MQNEKLNWLRNNPECESIRLAVCDLNGVLRGKRVLPSTIEKIVSEGSRMPISTSCIDIWGADLLNSPFLFESGDSDGMVIPTGCDFIPVTWLDKPTAILPAWIYTDQGEPSPIDPRHVLKAVLDRFTSLELTPVAAFELEFYLLDDNSNKVLRPIDPITKKRLANTSVLSIDDLDGFEKFFSEFYSVCNHHDIPADTAISENSAGQFEINLKHCDNLLQAADHALYFKKILKAIARKHNYRASFMSKPFLDSAGNGMHIHLSILDKGGKNIFDNGTSFGSKKLRNAVAGLLKTMPDSTLIFAPHLNSYRRLQIGSHAPTSICWGYENRSASIRIPGGKCKDTRIEHRVSGADANPYLVAAAVLSGALHGIERELEPPEPLKGDSYIKKLPQIPGNWNDAIKTFKNSKLNKALYSKVFVDVFKNCKQQEFETFNNRMEDFELYTYLDSV